MDGKVLGIERRRRWSKDEKARIVEETLTPGAVVSEVARPAARRGSEPALHLAKAGARGGGAEGARRLDLAAGRDRRDGPLPPAGGGEAAAPSDEPTADEVRRHRDRTLLREPRARRQRRRRRRASSGSERSGRTMIPMPSGVRVWIAAGHTDVRRGMQGLALQVKEQLKRDPASMLARSGGAYWAGSGVAAAASIWA